MNEIQDGAERTQQGDVSPETAKAWARADAESFRAAANAADRDAVALVILSNVSQEPHYQAAMHESAPDVERGVQEAAARLEEARAARSTGTVLGTEAERARRLEIEATNDGLLAVPRDSLGQAEAAGLARKDAAALEGIDNPFERHFAAAAMGHSAREQSAYATELKAAAPEAAWRASWAYALEEREQIAKEAAARAGTEVAPSVDARRESSPGDVARHPNGPSAEAAGSPVFDGPPRPFETEFERAGREVSATPAAMLTPGPLGQIEGRAAASYDGMEPRVAREWARMDQQDMVRLQESGSKEEVQAAALVMQRNASNPEYQDEIAKLTGKEARLIDGDRASFMGPSDRDGASLAPDRQQPEGEVGAKFIADLDARMAQSDLQERGWRGRSDLDDVMRDLERLAAANMPKAAELWDKYRPDDKDKPPVIRGEEVDHGRSTQSKAANDEIDARRDQGARDRREAEAEAETKREFMTPEAVRRRFLEAEGGKFYFRDDSNKLAFEDTGKRMATAHDDPEVARSMVAMAEAKGWSTLKVKGTEDFKREIWLQASLRGIDVQGFQPRDVDRAKLAELRQESAQEVPARRANLNTVEQGAERSRGTRQDPTRAEDAATERAAVVDEQVRGLSGQQRTAVETIKAILRERGDSERAVEMAGALAAERFQTGRVVVGKVLEHGGAPYENDPRNEKSYYVKLETQTGPRTVWGVDLPRALQEGGVKEGDQIVLAYQGRKEVEVSVNVRDDKGNVVGKDVVNTFRNAWDARRLDQVRDEVKQQLDSRPERQPIVKVYDRDAQRSQTRVEPVQEQARSNERTRA